MTGMDDLVQWLRAQLDDDAELAASGETWSAFDETTQGTRRVDVDHSFERVVACTRAWRGQHIARHDPARVLREIDAKRQIIDLMAGMLTAAKGDSEVDHYGGLGAAEDTLELLALPYADRPGYREEWRP